MNKGMYVMEDFQPSKMSNGLKEYLSKSSQKNDPDNFKEQRIKPLGLVQFLLSLVAMGIMFFASLYSSTNIYVSIAIMFVVAIIVIGVTLIYFNTYVMITRIFVETCNFKGHKNKIEYKNITGYNVYDDGYETGIVLQGSGKIVNNGRDINSVQASSVCANLAYLQAQLTFRILNNRWAKAHSEDDQKLLFDYIDSGRAQEVCMSRGGTVFSNAQDDPAPMH